MDILEIKSWLVLANKPGIGPALFVQLVESFGSAQAVLSLSEEQCQQKGFSPQLIALLRAPHPELPLAKVEALLENGISFITYQDDSYPQRLKQIASYPPFLFACGNVSLLNQEKAIGLVGTRTPTVYGVDQARKLTLELVSNDFVIVSGFALGIDIECHRICFENGGKTIAVLAHGLDRIAPSSHKKFQKPLLDSGGLFVSDFLPDTIPYPSNFPKRNRIISGLSKGVLIIEAKERSGALITARYALEQNRDVFAVPGDVNSEFSRGPHRLIQGGAKLVNDVSDILDEWNYQKQIEMSFNRPAKRDELIELISQGEDTIDHLIHKTQKPASVIMSRLVELEIDGKVTLMPGGKYRIL